MNYTGKTKGVMGYPRFELMKHILKENIAIWNFNLNKYTFFYLIK